MIASCGPWRRVEAKIPATTELIAVPGGMSLWAWLLGVGVGRSPQSSNAVPAAVAEALKALT